MIYRENLETPYGSIELTAENGTTMATPIGETWVDVWGKMDGEKNPIYPPRSQGIKSVSQYGGVEGYKNSKDARQLFYFVSHGQFLSFTQRAIDFFSRTI